MTRTGLPSVLAACLVTIGGACSSDGGSDGTASTTTGGSETTGMPTTDPSSTTEPTTDATTTDATTTDATTTTSPSTDATTTESGSETTTVAESSTTEVDTTAAESSSTGDDTTTGGEALPDIDMTVVYDLTVDSVYEQNVDFSPDSCPAQLGCLGGTGNRRLLRFSTITPNLADVDFHVGNPLDNPEMFVESPCGGGWLFNDYAHYSLVDDAEVEVGYGFKNAFALIDLQQWEDDAGPPQYGFNGDMGISAGWADIYDAALDCQWVDITDVPPGSYTLRISINPEQVVAEASFENNLLEIPVVID